MDLIERQAAIDAFMRTSYIAAEDRLISVAVIKALPTAQPQRMQGRWEDAHRYGWNGTYWFIKCNNCEYERKDDNHDLDAEYKFCPNCGARMDGGEQDG